MHECEDGRLLLGVGVHMFWGGIFGGDIWRILGQKGGWTTRNIVEEKSY